MLTRAAVERRRHSIPPPSNIDKLPDELLHRIFEYLALEAFRKPRWLVFSLVCRRWRHLALASPLLWASPDFSIPKLAMEMVDRSRSVPLHIEIFVKHECPADFQLEAVRYAFAHWNRVRALEISQYNATLLPIYEAVPFDVQSTALQSLDIAYSCFGGEATPSSWTIPMKKLETCYPHLRSLKLRQVGVDWASACFPDLTCLHIMSCLPAPSWTVLLGILKEAPRLTDVYIGTRSAWDPKSGAPSVSLPHLEELCITGRADGCLAVIDNVQFPLTCRVTFSPHGFPKKEGNHNLQMFRTAAANYARRLTQRAPFSCLDMKYSLIYGASLTFSTPLDDIPPFKIDATLARHDIAGLVGWMEHGWADSVEELVLSGDFGYDAQYHWNNPQGLCLPRAKALRIQGKEAYYTFTGVRRSESGNVRSIVDYSGPESTLILSSIHESLTWLRSTQGPKLLFNFLKVKNEEGKRIGKLVFEDCTGFNSLLEQFESVVGTVEGLGKLTRAAQDHARV